MDYVFISAICAITGTVAVLFVQVYLYGVYREPYMGAWIVGWILHFTRLALFESGIIDWKYSFFTCITYQMFYISCALMLVYSAHLVVNKKLNKLWLYGAAISFLLSIVCNLMNLPEFWKLIPCTWLSGIILFRIAYIFICKSQIKGPGTYIAGYAFALWGVLTAAAFLFADNISVSKWILATGINRLVIAYGVLLVYFEKTRLDLVTRENYYRSLADNSVDIVYHYQLLPKINVEYISPSVYLITGYTPEEFYTRPNLFECLIHPDDVWAFRMYINNPSWPMDVPFDLRLIHKNLNIIYIEQNFVPIYDIKGNLIGRQGILRDVTARNNISQVQTQYDRLNMVGKMAVSFAHHIRNPLTTVRGYLQMRRIKCVYKDSYNLMIEEIDKANAVISEYVLLAQDKRADLKKCVLSSIIHSALPLLQTYASSSKVVIKTELTDVPELTLDEMEIRCMLINMIRNGIDAMPTGGELKICTFFSKSEVILSISDQGDGIPEDILNDLGTPFMTTKKTGVGLGLSLCYRIATRNQADIRVDSDKEGTTFYIHFAAAESDDGQIELLETLFR